MESEDPDKLKVSPLPGETIDALKPNDFPSMSDAELNKRYVSEGVRIVVEQARYPLNQILGMFTDTFETESGKTVAKYRRDPEYHVVTAGTMPQVPPD